MGNCIIHPIPLVELSMDKSLMTYRLNFGQPFNLISYVWYIEGTKERILVDAGASSEYLSKFLGIPARKIQKLDSGLSKLGTSCDDIDIIILTHLHEDHVACASQFSKAKFFVQERELEFAYNPHPLVASSFCREFFENLDFAVIDGDAQICDEISVISTPGHTPGGQSVTVKTAKGVAIIAGLCLIRENFEPPLSLRKKISVIPPGLHTNALDAYDSVLKIKEMAEIIVPLHEPEFRHIQSIP
jgi:N-acyl homoserine lactone hydrolase